MRSMRLATLVSAVVMVACTSTQEPLRVEHAWAPPTPPGVNVAAVYMEITSTRQDALLSATSSAAERVEMHISENENGMMRMRRLERVELPAGVTLRFEPGGRHFMVMGLRAPLAAGESLPLELTLANAGTIRIAAAVQQGDHSH